MVSPRPTPGSSRTPDPPDAVRWITRTLEKAGYETWAVGGAVRDSLAGIGSGDWDLTTRARPGTVRRIFRRTIPIGMDHGTVGVLARDGTLFEVTTFRRDVETRGRHAVVEFADRLEDDLARRDFTINAVAWHPLREELCDPYGGVEDLRRGLLRTVGVPGERFREDYLRVLRALRFAGSFRLEVERETWDALCRAMPQIRRLSAERIREELTKILGGDDVPSRALSLYAASGALAVVLPELERTVALPGPDGGSTDDVWSRRLRTVDLLPSHRPVLRLAALFAGAGSPPASSEEESIRPVGEPERGAARTARIMERLRFSNARTRQVALTVEAALRPIPGEPVPPAVRRWLHQVGRERVRPVLRIRLAEARGDMLQGGTRREAGSRQIDRILGLRARAVRELREDVPLEVGDLAIGGRQLIALGLRPGPHFQEILEHLLGRVLEDPLRNDPDWLREAARRYAEEREGDG